MPALKKKPTKKAAPASKKAPAAKKPQPKDIQKATNKVTKTLLECHKQYPDRIPVAVDTGWFSGEKIKLGPLIDCNYGDWSVSAMQEKDLKKSLAYWGPKKELAKLETEYEGFFPVGRIINSDITIFFIRKPAK